MVEAKIKRFKDFIGGMKKADFETFPSFLNSSMVSWAGLLILAFVATLLTTVSLQRIPTNVKEGMIAARNIKADRNYEIVDEDTTIKERNDAVAKLLSVYDLDDSLGDEIVKRVRDTFEKMRDIYSEDKLKDLEILFSENLSVTLTPEQWKALVTERFSERAESAIATLVRQAMSRPVVAERGQLDTEKAKGIIVRVPRAGAGDETVGFGEKIVENVGQILSTDEAKLKTAKQNVSTFGLKAKNSPAAIANIAALLLEPNLILNRAETKKRADDVAANVKSTIIKINAGEMIIREGSPYKEQDIKVLRGIMREKRRGLYSLEFAGTFLLVLLFLMVPFYLLERFFRRVQVSKADHILMAAVGLATIALVRISLMLAPAVRDVFFLNVSAQVFLYLIPVAGAAMLVRMFLSAEVSFVFSVALCSIIGFFVEADVRFVAFTLLQSFTAVIAIADADKRSTIIRAGIITGAVGALALVGICLAKFASSTEPLTLTDLGASVAFAFLSGIGSAIFTMIGASFIESVSGYTSDIKLLELANLNHPLLKELIVRAPGTYHHSHMVGILGEAAAEAIGAKALLVRVGAYYHDIGKIKKPSYFIENARPGDNKHDKISPHMSSLIIGAHVKDGIDMALQAKIPKAITDMLAEHHGTRLIGYFFDKAKELEDSSVQNIGESEFAYPGPKPQTREAAILMLADATEAAVRALKEKSTTRIQQTVQRVITDIFTEKQLDECELTLRDLNDIARAFIRILLGIYHSRIEYPKDGEHEKTETSIVDECSTSQDDVVEPNARKKDRS